MSERRGCAALGVGRSGVRYRLTKPDQAPLRLRICDLAKSRARYGNVRIDILLRRKGWRVNHRRVHRLYRDEGLSLWLSMPRRHVSAAVRERQSAALRPNERGSMDIVSDALFDSLIASREDSVRPKAAETPDRPLLSRPACTSPTRLWTRWASLLGTGTCRGPCGHLRGCVRHARRSH